MAKTPVAMKIDGYKDREVMMVNYEFEQETDVEGQMSGIPRGGKIQVRVKALNDGTPDLLAWMTERNLPKNGSIEFLETKTGKASERWHTRPAGLDDRAQPPEERQHRVPRDKDRQGHEDHQV